MNALNSFLFVAFPYVAMIVFVVGVAFRYREMGFKVSSLSSQFLESKKLFWGVIPFHFGLLMLFLGHLTAFLMPETTLAWNSEPARLIIIEVAAFIFGMSVLVGLLTLIWRRLTNERLKMVTTRMDIAVELLLLSQIIMGCWIALGYRWGSSWFASDLTPYLWSLFKLQPETAVVFVLPWIVKLHIFGAFLIVFMVPFSRLIHFVVIPLHYLTRPHQVVMWNWDRLMIRNAKSPWTRTRPKNN